MKRSIGIALLLIVFAVLFLAVSATNGGIANAAIIFGLTIALTAVIVFAVWLTV